MPERGQLLLRSLRHRTEVLGPAAGHRWAFDSFVSSHVERLNEISWSFLPH